MEVITNNVPRLTVPAYDLTEAERADFDYLDWSAIDVGADGADFARYHGRLYDMAEFMSTSGELEAAGWHGIDTDTFFSATVVRIVDEDSVVMGRVYV